VKFFGPFEPIKPLELDWRESGVVTRVKRQGRCGACWAIAAAGALEGASAIQNGNLIEMSEQQILDCASMEPFRSVKCDGGYISEALRYSKTTLLATRDNYPYLGFNNTCRKISNNDLMSFLDVPKITNGLQFQSLVEFWSLYYQNKFINEFQDAATK
jgi:C1A family cysteine protease